VEDPAHAGLPGAESSGTRAGSLATYSMAARISWARTVPARAPLASTTTPRRLGDDSAESRVLRRLLVVEATVPPRWRDPVVTWPLSRSGSTQPSGRWSLSVTRSQPPSAPAAWTSAADAPRRTVGSP